MRIVVATTNAGKLRELNALFDPGEFELATFANYRAPDEGSTSYAQNAALKAHALYAQLQAAGAVQAVVADDSGLEVWALDRRPGVVTADYGGANTDWPQRRALLLGEVAASGRTDRRARFVCAMHFIGADEREFATYATVDGEIAQSQRGYLGFSFDPVFVYLPLDMTFAQMSDEQKNWVSHRALAVCALTAALRAAYPPASPSEARRDKKRNSDVGGT